MSDNKVLGSHSSGSPRKSTSDIHPPFVQGMDRSEYEASIKKGSASPERSRDTTPMSSDKATTTPRRRVFIKWIDKRGDAVESKPIQQSKPAQPQRNRPKRPRPKQRIRVRTRDSLPRASSVPKAAAPSKERARSKMLSKPELKYIYETRSRASARKRLTEDRADSEAVTEADSMTRAAAQKIAEDRAAEEAAAKAAAEALAAEEAAAEAHAANVARAKAAASQAHAAEKAALMEATAANVANRDQTPESISALRTAIDKARAAEAAARKAEEDVVRASDPALAGAADILCDLKRKALQRMVSIKTVPNRPVSSGMQADGDTIAKGIEDLEGRHRELEAGQILLLLRYSSGS